MVGRVDDEIKGSIYGLYAMTEIIKEIPDTRLAIIGIQPPEYLLNLIKELKLEDNVDYPGFITNITEFYLNTSVY